MKKKIFNIFIFILLISALFFINQDIATAPPSEDYEYYEENGVAVITGYIGNGGDITIPSTLGGLPAGIIGNDAFNPNKGYNGHLITSVIIPNSVTSIENNAFYGCTIMDSITIGSSVSDIGNYILQYCSNLVSINLLMHNPPAVCDCWIDDTPPTLRGHALKNSNFPLPGETWEAGKLIMGTYIILPPNADFTYSPNYPTEWDNISFYDESTDADGYITNWYWDFDDGYTSTKQNPKHRYADDGIYNIELMVIDDDGASNSITKILDMSNNKPYAHFIYSPSSPTTIDIIQFTDSSPDSDGTVVSWSWDFGDGTTSTQQDPTHIYEDNGIYTVTLTVTDDDGAIDSTTMDITISNIINIPPIAQFTYNPSSPTESEIIQFTDTSTDPDGMIISWNWNFGDSTNGSGKTIKHFYTTQGTYQVILTVTDNNGSTNTYKTNIIITKENNPPTQPTINGPVFGNKNKKYTFTVTSSDPDKDNIYYSIIWGDQTSYVNTSTSLPSNTPYTFSHSWTTPGAYTIRVHSSDNKTDSQFTYHIVLIDIEFVGKIGYLINLTGNSDYEKFYSNVTMKETYVEKKPDNAYLIDSDSDGNWDYIYNEQKELTPYQSSKTPGFELIFIIEAIIISLILLRKRKNRNL